VPTREETSNNTTRRTDIPKRNCHVFLKYPTIVYVTINSEFNSPDPNFIVHQKLVRRDEVQSLSAWQRTGGNNLDPYIPS